MDVTASTVSDHPTAAEWATRLGYRLKSLRLDLASSSAEVRAERLEEGIRAALSEVPVDLRPRYLETLAELFPSWKEASAAVYTAKYNPAPDEIIERFFKLVPELDDDQRRALTEKLEANGFSVGGKSLDGEALAEVQSKLKMANTDPIDSQRLGKLFASFMELTFVLDQLVWNVWRSAAPKSAMKRDPGAADLRALVRRSLSGDAEVSAAQVQQQLEVTRQLIAGLLAGLGSAGQDFAQRFQQKLSPEAIRASLSGEGAAGFFGNAEAKCWKKYTEAAADLTEENIATDIRGAVVKYAEDLIRGRNR